MAKDNSTNPGKFPFAVAVLLLAGIPFVPRDAAAATVPATVHPDWTKFDLRPSPATFRPQVSGMAFQSDGKLVIAHWNASRNLGGHTNQVSPRMFNSRIYVLDGVQGNSPGVTVDTIAAGLEDLMGLTLVNDTIYVSGGNVIVRLLRAGGLSGPVTRRDTVFILPGTPVGGDSLNPNRGRQEYLNGLLHHNGKFYIAPSSADPSTAGTAQINPFRGEYLEVTPGNGTSDKRGGFRRMASGLRAPSGIGFGPDGLHCVSDNQGEWLPGNKLNCLQEGSHHGFQKTGVNNYYNPFNGLAYTPPTAWVVQDVIGNSPTAPIYVPDGLYAGQMLMGDARWGTGINRYFLEKNGQGNLQAGIFVFTGGLEGGVFRMAWGPDGHLYAGMAGGRDDGDGWPKNQSSGSRVDYGLQKLRYNPGDTAFEMLAVRSRSSPQGFEIEFTKAVNAAVAQQTASYTVQSAAMNPNSSYGGGAGSFGNHTVQSIQVSPDGRKVFLAVSGISPSTPTAQRVVYIRLNGYKSAANDDPWAAETWYTLNAFAPGSPFDPPASLGPPLSPAPSRARAGSPDHPHYQVRGGNLIIRAPFGGPFEIRLRDARGALIGSFRGSGTREQSFPVQGFRGKFAVLELRGGGTILRRTLLLP